MTAFAGLKTRDYGERTVVEIEAQNVDFRNCENIKAAIHSIVAGGKKHLILDLQQVGFMDSSGLSILLYCKRICDEAGGTIALCCLQNYVNNLVQLTNLDKSIDVFLTEADATQPS